MTCAAGLRALAAVSPDDPAAARWAGLANTIVADTTAFAVHPSGRWQRAAGDPRNDGALLLPAIRGAIAPDDPRSVRTLRAYIDELTQDGYAYRFRHDERPLGQAEGAFLLQRQLRGNIPQAFVHAIMLETAARLATPP